MRVEIVGATTHIDRHNMCMTKEALDSAAKQVNGGRKPRVGVEHDSTIPPVGKILAARVEPMEDGQYRLVNVAEIFEDFKVIRLSDGTVLLKQECETDRYPFVIMHNDISDRVVLAYDRVNFGVAENRRSFLDEVRRSSQIAFDEREFFRKAVIPDPEIVIRLGKLFVEYLIARKALDKIGDRAIDLAVEELSKFYVFVRSVSFAAIKYAIPKNRPVTYVFEIPGNPHIEFVICSSDANVVVSSITLDRLESPLAQARGLHELLGAEQIQFLLDPQDGWEFNYLLTSAGEVIGTPKSFSRRDHRVRRLRFYSNKAGDSHGNQDALNN